MTAESNGPVINLAIIAARSLQANMVGGRCPTRAPRGSKLLTRRG